MDKKDQIALSLGIIIISIALTAFVISVVTIVKESGNTDFTTAQANELKSWITQMSFNADQTLVAKGFTDNTSVFLATKGEVNTDIVATTELKVGDTVSIKDGVLTMGTGTTLNATTLTTTDITATTGVCTNLNCSTIQSGTWNGDPIDVAHGGTGLTTLSPNLILCGGTTATGNLQQVPSGTAGQFLSSQGPSALPQFITGPSILGSSYVPVPVFIGPGVGWTLSLTQPDTFYTVIGNNYTVYGKITATNTLTSGGGLVPFNVYLQVPGTGVFSDTTSLRGNVNSVDLLTANSIVMYINSYVDITTRFIELEMSPSIGSIASAPDDWEFNFVCSYRI